MHRITCIYLSQLKIGSRGDIRKPACKFFRYFCNANQLV